MSVILSEILWFSNDLSKMSIIIVFSILYCRVKLFKLALESDLRSKRSRCCVNKYVQMYGTLVDTLKATHYPLKLLIVASIFTNTPTLVYGLYQEVLHFKEVGPDGFLFTWIVGHGCQFVVFHIIMMTTLDLTVDNLNEVKSIALERQVYCTDDRERFELRNLLNALKHRPLTYSVYRALPLSVYLTLSFMSFCFINMIAILQIKSYMV
ncbi:uncharacterized protein LOC142982981 [Anticarsia gemmatalis]|uniref:uncharacterized protein LOC142982981 n=1 Tax=Anticarsia gemmatalis TaxID=129554 RepID=UPI003F7769EE